MERCVAWAALAIALTFGACSESAVSPSLEPSYEGCATDENWLQLDHAPEPGASARPAEASPIFLAPSPDTALVASAPARFRFALSAEDTTPESGDASCPQYQPRTHAAQPRHLPAVTGTLFDLRFFRGSEPIYRVLTTRRFASLPPARWQALAGARLQVSLSYVRLEKNVIVAGPHAAPPLALTIGPP